MTDEQVQRQIWGRRCPELLAERDRYKAVLDELLDAWWTYDLAIQHKAQELSHFAEEGAVTVVSAEMDVLYEDILKAANHATDLLRTEPPNTESANAD